MKNILNLYFLCSHFSLRFFSVYIARIYPFQIISFSIVVQQPSCSFDLIKKSLLFLLRKKTKECFVHFHLLFYLMMFSLSRGNNFSVWWTKHAENVFKELMEVLSINTVYKLLLVREGFFLSVFQKKYRELEKITERACLHLDDGSILLKPGFTSRFRSVYYSSSCCVRRKSSPGTNKQFERWSTFIVYNIDEIISCKWKQ